MSFANGISLCPTITVADLHLIRSAEWLLRGGCIWQQGFLAINHSALGSQFFTFPRLQMNLRPDRFDRDSCHNKNIDYRVTQFKGKLPFKPNSHGPRISHVLGIFLSFTSSIASMCPLLNTRGPGRSTVSITVESKCFNKKTRSKNYSRTFNLDRLAMDSSGRPTPSTYPLTPLWSGVLSERWGLVYWN